MAMAISYNCLFLWDKIHSINGLFLVLITSYNWYNLGHNCIHKRSNRQCFPGISQVPREGPWEMRHGTILPPAAARRGNALDPPNERWLKQRQRSGGATQ